MSIECKVKKFFDLKQMTETAAQIKSTKREIMWIHNKIPTCDASKRNLTSWHFNLKCHIASRSITSPLGFWACWRLFIIASQYDSCDGMRVLWKMPAMPKKQAFCSFHYRDSDITDSTEMRLCSIVWMSEGSENCVICPVNGNPV